MYSYICSEHFEPSCFVVRPGKIGCHLNDNAVHTIFPTFSQYYQRTEKAKRKSPCKQKPAVILVSPSIWTASVNCEPGFLCDIIKLLGGMVQNKSSASDVVPILMQCLCTKAPWWDPIEWCYVGTVDYGTDLPKAEDELATEALVFMLSSISGHWKHPIVM